MCPPGTDGTGPAAGPTRVALLDEYPAVLEAMASLLDASRHFAVAARAMNGGDLVTHLAASPVGVVVAEPWLRSGDGLDALRRAREIQPELVIIALSRIWDRGHVDQLLAIGARAYIPKSTDLHEIPRIIRRAQDGMLTLPADLPRDGGAALLTPREAEVLAMAAEGMDNRAIAGALVVTERTVKFHLQNAYRKLGVTNRTAAAAAARRLGLIQ